MNIHYQIFHKLLPLIERTAIYIESNGGADLSFSEELCYLIMSSCHFRIGSQIDKLLYSDEFCIFCMYANINNVRKSTSRYLSLEKDINVEASILLKDMNNTANDICILINENYNRNDKEHETVENLAIPCITSSDFQRVKDTQLDFQNDDSDDDEII